EHFANQVLAAPLGEFPQNARRFHPQMLWVCCTGVGKTADETLLDIGVQMRLEVVPLRVMAAKDQLLVGSLLGFVLESLRHLLEVMSDFIRNPALGMAGI